MIFFYDYTMEVKGFAGRVGRKNYRDIFYFNVK